MARALRTARSHTLGIAVPQLDNPVFAQIIIGATTAAQARGYELLISLVEQVAGGGGVYNRLAHASRVDGLLVATLDEEASLKRTLAGTAALRAGEPQAARRAELRRPRQL